MYLYYLVFVFVQAYQHYQEVKYISAMVDDFGVDDELRSNEEPYSGTFSQLMNISCTIVADEEQSQSASLFEAACAEKIQQFDDSESDEEVCDIHVSVPCPYISVILQFCRSPARGLIERLPLPHHWIGIGIMCMNMYMCIYVYIWAQYFLCIQDFTYSYALIQSFHPLLMWTPQ